MSVSHTNRVQRTSKTRRIYEQCVDLSDLDLLGLGHVFRQMALRMGLTSSHPQIVDSSSSAAFVSDDPRLHLWLCQSVAPTTGPNARPRRAGSMGNTSLSMSPNHARHYTWCAKHHTYSSIVQDTMLSSSTSILTYQFSQYQVYPYVYFQW